jgi:hypothetical protein
MDLGEQQCEVLQISAVLVQEREAVGAQEAAAWCEGRTRNRKGFSYLPVNMPPVKGHKA